MTEFDPLTQTLFRDKPITELSREELIEALVEALKEVHRIEGFAYAALRRS